MNSLYTIGCIICKFSLTVLTLSFFLNPSAHSLLICNLRLVVTISGQDAPWRRDRLRTPVFLGFSGGSDSKVSACNAGNLSSIPGLGRSPGGGHGNPLHYSCLENSHGQRSLVGYRPWGRKESNRTEQLSTFPNGDPFLQIHFIITKTIPLQKKQTTWK